MVRTKKADLVEAHNTESCVCSDCKTRKLELEVIDLKARYADERSHYEVRLTQIRDEIVKAMVRVENRINDDWRTSLVSLSNRVDGLEKANISEVHYDIEGRIKNLEERSEKVEYGHTQRLRSLEANRPIAITDRDVSQISRDLKEVGRRMERIIERLSPPF